VVRRAVQVAAQRDGVVAGGQKDEEVPRGQMDRMVARVCGLAREAAMAAKAGRSSDEASPLASPSVRVEGKFEVSG